MPEFPFISTWLAELKPPVIAKLFYIIDSDPATLKIRAGLRNFKSIEAYILDSSCNPSFKDYTLLRLINIALFECAWQPEFVAGNNSLAFDYSHPQNIGAMAWFGSTECSARHEWVCLCESWNNRLKTLNEICRNLKGKAFTVL